MSCSKSEIEKRKRDHLEIVCDKDVGYKKVSSGFENYRFIHNALPELDLDMVDVSIEFLGYSLNVPLMISGMAGGGENGNILNADLAKAANAEKVALGLGSIRPALENPAVISSYSIARKNAPDIPIIANLGAAQLRSNLSSDDLIHILKDIGADAIAIHLNPLQELLQPEGEPLFCGVSRAIEILKDTIPLPIIVKEVGFGLSFDVIRRLRKIGIEWIDIAGAGGTCWAKVEHHRAMNEFLRNLSQEFFEWGIPTAEVLVDAAKIKGVNIIASGGIDTGIEFSKAIALGATLSAAAKPFLHEWHRKNVDGVRERIRLFKETLRLALFCTGCASLNEFRGNSRIISRI